MDNKERFTRRLARLINSNFGPGDVRISIHYAPVTSRVPTEAEARAAALAIKRFCDSLTAETACSTCAIRDMCKTEPYSWVLPCADCGKDADPLIRCRIKGAVCPDCCEACHESEPFPCRDYDAYKRRVQYGAV